MQLRLKNEEINLDGLWIETVDALAEAMHVWRKYGMQNLTVTSANDGAHMDGSLHYAGQAFDLRSRTLPDIQGMAFELHNRLGPRYDVVIEDDHIHVEFDPEGQRFV